MWKEHKDQKVQVSIPQNFENKVYYLTGLLCDLKECNQKQDCPIKTAWQRESSLLQPLIKKKTWPMVISVMQRRQKD